MTDSGRFAIMGETQEELSFCPTFNSYSSDGLAEIAARVTSEFTESYLSVLREGNDDEGDEFEFSLVRDGPEIFYDGQFRPIFPIFNRDPVASDGHDGDGVNDQEDGKKSCDNAAVESQIGIPLKNLFLQDREEREPPSSSSSEADEMEGVPPGTYCVWKPKTVESSPNLCKKSNSTGSASSSNSKRWKFLNLLRRSNSEGKDTYVFLTPKHGEVKSGKDEPEPNSEGVKAARRPKPRAAGELPSPSQSPSRSSAHEAFYVRNRAIKQGDKKKSYLPYRKDLVGFFASVNGLSRTSPPF